MLIIQMLSIKNHMLLANTTMSLSAAEHDQSQNKYLLKPETIRSTTFYTGFDRLSFSDDCRCWTSCRNALVCAGGGICAQAAESVAKRQSSQIDRQRNPVYQPHPDIVFVQLQLLCRCCMGCR